MKSDIQQCIQKKKDLQQALLDYLSSSNKIEENYQNLIRLLDDQSVAQNKYELTEFLHMISYISNNHYRSPTLFSKVEKILLQYKKEIQDSISNRTIFNIFKNNKKALLFLFDKKMLIPDMYITDIMLSTKYKRIDYPIYFYPELKKYIKKKKEDETNKIDPQNRKLVDYNKKKEENYGELYNKDPATFEEKRKNGFNDNLTEILDLIRNDNIDDFISYVNQKETTLTDYIPNSIYETSPFLYGKKTTLIEFASFYGSIQIFKYLASKDNIKLTSSLWLYAIHGDHPEIFSILEEKKIEPTSYVKCYKEAVKCHHNDIAKYIEDLINSKKCEDENDEQNKKQKKSQKKTKKTKKN